MSLLVILALYVATSFIFLYAENIPPADHEISDADATSDSETENADAIFMAPLIRTFRFRSHARSFKSQSTINAFRALCRLVCTPLKQRNPISARLELASLGFLTILWLALAGFLAGSASAEADVECFSSSSSLEDPVEDPECERLFQLLRGNLSLIHTSCSHHGHVSRPV